MSKTLKIYSTLLVLFVGFSCHAMIYDNKFFPLGRYRFSRRYEDSTIAVPQLFTVVSKKGHGATGNDVDLYSLLAPRGFDLAVLGKAIQDAGNTNPVRSSWRNSDIKWKMKGVIKASGCSITYNQPLTENWSCGAHTMFMHMRSRVKMEGDFAAGDDPIPLGGTGDIDELYRTRLAANNLLGITSEVSSQAGFGDLDTYFRFGNRWDYPRKFKRIDAGFNFGVTFPTGERRHNNNAASLPFGGDGHYGLYIEGDSEFELKEDLKVDIFTRLIKRLPRTLERRVPTDQWREPVNYGAIVGNFKVSPGFAWVISMRLAMEDINKGFGASLRYTWTKKWCDEWTDKRSDQSLNFAKDSLERLSQFTSEYITVNIFYDLSKRVKVDENGPLFSLIWDIPITQLGGHRVAVTHKIAFGVEWDF